MFLQSTQTWDIEHYLLRHPSLRERLRAIEEVVKLRFPGHSLSYAVELADTVEGLDQDPFCGLVLYVEFPPDAHTGWVWERIRLVNEAIEPFLRFSGGNLRVAPRFLGEACLI